MSFVGLRRASRSSWAFGFVLASVHLLVVVAVMRYTAHGSRDAQWELAFVPLELLDLPAALVGFPLGLAAAWGLHSIGITADPTFVMVLVANGLIGTAFYLVLPPAVSAHLQFKRESA